MKQVIGFTPRDFQNFSMEAQLCYDGCYTIAELFDRYMSGLPIPTRSSVDWEDDDIENPLDYDADIADYPTRHTIPHNDVTLAENGNSSSNHRADQDNSLTNSDEILEQHNQKNE